MMRVLMVIPTFAPVVGGAERQLEGLVPELVQLGCDVTVVTRALRGTVAKERQGGYLVRRLSTGGLRLGFHISLVTFLLFRGRGFDVIHCHTLSGPALVCALLGAVVRRPVLLKITRSGPGSQIQGWHASAAGRLAFKVMRFCASRFIAISADTLMELQRFGVRDWQLCHVPNGVVVPPPSPRQSGPPLTVVYTGRLIARKRVDLLLRAYAGATNARTATRLVIIGAGPELPRLKQLVAQLGIGMLVEFAGELPSGAVLHTLQQAHIFVLASSSEGMSNSLLEAMAAGLAVVCTDIAANRDLIEHNVSGLLFTDEIALSRCLDHLVTDVGSRERLAAGAYDWVHTHHSFRAIATRYRDLYASCLSVRRAQES